MKHKLTLEEPLNAEERMLHGINIRLEVLIDMFSSFLDVYANDKRIATTSNTVKESNDVKEVEEVAEVFNETAVEDKSVYSSLSKSEISSILEEKGIEHNTRMSKSALIELI